MAKELVDRGVAVIAATGDVSSARAAKAATTRMPRLHPRRRSRQVRPGRRLPGRPGQPHGHRPHLECDRRQARGGAARGGSQRQDRVVHEPRRSKPTTEQKDAEEAARALGHQTVVVQARNKVDFDAAFETLIRERIQALFVATDPMLLSQREAVFAAQQKLPAIYFVREFALAGGLISYGGSIRWMYRQAGCTRVASSRVQVRPSCRCCSPRSSKSS